MHRALRSIRSLGTAGVVAAVLILLMPQAAQAAITLDDGVVRTAKAGTDYSVTADKVAWSAVAVYSSSNYNVSLFDRYGGWLTSSYGYGYGQTEFIAINSHLLPRTVYQPRTSSPYGPGLSYTQWRQAATKTILPDPANDGVTGPSDPDLTFTVLSNRDVVSVSNIYLTAGESFWAKTVYDTNFFLLESNPYDSTTYLRNRDQAATAGVVQVVPGCTLYRANYTGWHGLLMVSNTAPVTTTPPGGLAIALHRFDPARPATCPMRNFPDYTPPGP